MPICLTTDATLFRISNPGFFAARNRASVLAEIWVINTRRIRVTGNIEEIIGDVVAFVVADTLGSEVLSRREGTETVVECVALG